jgi:hypothetical protein
MKKACVLAIWLKESEICLLFESPRTFQHNNDLRLRPISRYGP